MDKPQTDTKSNEPTSELQDRATLEEARTTTGKRRREYLAAIDKDLPAKVDAWKEKFQGVEISSVHIGGQLFIYRGLNRGEYMAIMTQGFDKGKNEEHIASRGLLWPEISMLDWVTRPAGLPITLSDLILAASSFGTEEVMPIRL